MTKYRTDRQIQAETARGYRTDPEINLFTAFHALYDESTRKFNQKKFADNGRTTYWTEQRRNTVLTAPAEKLLQGKAYHYHSNL